MNKTIQAKHIPDDAIISVVQRAHAEGRWAHQWDMQEAYPDVPPKVLLAKCRSLIARNLIEGCACGCRGDFRPVES